MAPANVPKARRCRHNACFTAPGGEVGLRRPCSACCSGRSLSPIAPAEHVICGDAACMTRRRSGSVIGSPIISLAHVNRCARRRGIDDALIGLETCHGRINVTDFIAKALRKASAMRNNLASNSWRPIIFHSVVALAATSVILVLSTKRIEAPSKYCRILSPAVRRGAAYAGRPSRLIARRRRVVIIKAMPEYWRAISLPRWSIVADQARISSAAISISLRGERNGAMWRGRALGTLKLHGAKSTIAIAGALMMRMKISIPDEISTSKDDGGVFNEPRIFRLCRSLMPVAYEGAGYSQIKTMTRRRPCAKWHGSIFWPRLDMAQQCSWREHFEAMIR